MHPSLLERFHNELRAAVTSRVSLFLGKVSGLTHPTKTASNAQVDRLAAKAENHFKSGGSVSDLNDAISDSPTYVAALGIFEATNSMVPVLEGLSVTPVAIRKIRSVTRRSLIYLSVIVIVAAISLSLFSQNVLPLINELRTDLLRQSPIAETNTFELTLLLPQIATGFSIALIVGLVFCLTIGTGRLSIWLGGQRYIDQEVCSVASRIYQVLMDCGIPPEMAAQQCMQLTSASKEARQKFRGSVPNDANPEFIDGLGNYWTMAATKSLDRFRFATPVNLISIIGGSITFCYGLLVFWPIIRMIYELPQVVGVY